MTIDESYSKSLSHPLESFLKLLKSTVFALTPMLIDVTSPSHASDLAMPENGMARILASGSLTQPKSYCLKGSEPAKIASMEFKNASFGRKERSC